MPLSPTKCGDATHTHDSSFDSHAYAAGLTSAHACRCPPDRQVRRRCPTGVCVEFCPEHMTRGAEATQESAVYDVAIEKRTGKGDEQTGEGEEAGERTEGDEGRG